MDHKGLLEVGVEQRMHKYTHRCMCTTAHLWRSENKQVLVYYCMYQAGWLARTFGGFPVSISHLAPKVLMYKKCHVQCYTSFENSNSDSHAGMTSTKSSLHPQTPWRVILCLLNQKLKKQKNQGSHLKKKSPFRYYKIVSLTVFSKS